MNLTTTNGMLISLDGNQYKTKLFGYWKGAWKRIIAKPRNYQVDVYLYTDDDDYIWYEFLFHADNSILIKVIEYLANEMAQEYYPYYTFNYAKSYAVIQTHQGDINEHSNQ